MSDKPPPFVNYVPISAGDIWKKILSGDVAAHIYSSEAKGDFEPVPISAAELFTAHEASQISEFGGPDSRLRPYQIMWRDRDRRRPAATRRAISVPHWVYVMKADISAPDRGPGAVDLYDWDEIEQVVANLWQELGDFDLPDNRRDDWKSRTSVIEHVKNYLQKHNRKIPGDTQLKKRVGKIIGKLRRPE
jgi:hypothetical protein